MVDHKNAAGRLYLLLDMLRKKGKTITIQEAWAEIFNLDKKNLERIIIINAEMVKLTENIKNFVLAQEVNHDLYLKPFIKIQRVFALSLSHQVQNATELLDEATMVGLEHCSELLSRTNAEKEIEEKVLNDLLIEIAELEKKVKESTINTQLKSLILENLHEIRMSILNYRIHGTRGIEKAVKNTFGSSQYYTINNPIIRINNESDKKTVMQYISFVADILGIVSAGLNVPMLKENITKFLLGSGN